MDLSKTDLMINDSLLKIYNSDVFGNGKHIHLLNSQAVENNLDYLCKSGFTIDNDLIANTNTEKLRVIGHVNEDIPYHNHEIEFTSSLLDLRKGDEKQVLGFDSGTSTDSPTFKASRFELSTQSNNNTFRIPDGTGWMGLWRDTNETTEQWEVIEKASLSFKSIRFKYQGNEVYKFEGDTDIPLQFHDSSVVRFKRMNNWVLVDFHIGFQLINFDEEMFYVPIYYIKDYCNLNDLLYLYIQHLNYHIKL